MTDAADTPQVEPVEAPPAHTAEDYAALVQKVKSFEGRDRAFQQSQAELATARADKEAALSRLAEIDQANMSELEKAQKARDKAIGEANEAKAEAQHVIMTTKYPLAAAEYDGELLPSEAVLTKLEAKLRKEPAAAEEPESRMDPTKAPKNNTPPVVDPRDALTAAAAVELDRIRSRQ